MSTLGGHDSVAARLAKLREHQRIDRELHARHSKGLKKTSVEVIIIMIGMYFTIKHCIICNATVHQSAITCV